MNSVQTVKKQNLQSTASVLPALAVLQQAIYPNRDFTLQSPFAFRERNRFEGHQGSVRSVSFSPDGNTINSQDTLVKGWYTEAGTTSPMNTDGDSALIDNVRLPLPGDRDPDADNDGVTDYVEFNLEYADPDRDLDCNRDGIPNWRDPILCPVEFFQGFSPNGDGINDTYEVNGIENYARDNHFEVFNRWGDLVLEATDYQNDWDGTYNGRPLPEGTYYWVIDLGDGSEPQKGFVVIFR